MNFDRFYTELFTFLGMFVGLAVFALFLSKNSNTVGVIQAGAQGVGGLLTAATNPYAQSGNSYQVPTFNNFQMGTGGFY